MTPDDIRAWRERMGISVREAGTMLGYARPKQTFHRLQSGALAPSEVACRLMTAMDLIRRVHGLLERDEPQLAKETCAKFLPKGSKP
jgi:hypothetical protein